MWRILASTAAVMLFTVAHAAELTVLSPQALKAALDELIPQFERATDNKVAIVYSSTAAHIKQIEDDKIADLAILFTEQIDELDDDDKLVDDTATPIAKLSYGVIVRKGSSKPDVATVRSLKQTLLVANAIAVGDPEKSASGQYFVVLIERLKIAEALHPKMKIFATGTEALDAVANGEADVAILAAISADGVRTELAGLLPAQAKKAIVYSAAVLSTSTNVEAAKALLSFLSSKEALATMRAKGIDAP